LLGFIFSKSADNQEVNKLPVFVPAGPPHLEVVTQSLRGWTVRAGSFVAEKMALFERLGEDSRAATFLDR
jgi:hypothetical protein